MPTFTRSVLTIHEKKSFSTFQKQSQHTAQRHRENSKDPLPEGDDSAKVTARLLTRWPPPWTKAKSPGTEYHRLACPGP